MLRTTLLLSLAAGACALAAGAVGCSSDEGDGDPATAASSGDGGQGAAGDTGGEGGAPPGECAADDDCPGTNNACAKYACAQGECVPTFLAAGTLVPEQDVEGDCQRVICDGDSLPTSEEDADDIEDDLNPCTDDTCQAGAPLHTPVMDATPCGSGATTVCTAGVCVGCEADAECPLGDGCRDPVCDKGGGGPGKDGTCGLVISVGKEVGNASPDDCTHAVCDDNGAVVVEPNLAETPPQDDEACDNEVCDPAGGVAHQALADGAYCNGGTFCHPSTCVAVMCTAMADPPSGTVVSSTECASVVCDGAGNETTAFAGAGTACSVGVCDGAGTCTFF